MIVKCDVVKCKHNKNCRCIAEEIEIVLNNVGTTEIIECEMMEESVPCKTCNEYKNGEC